MRKDKLTRDEAIEIAGLAAVESVEKENCEPTNRVGYNGKVQGDSEIEWSASVSFQDADGNEGTLVMYYYTDADDMDDDGNPSNWDDCGFDIV